MTQLEKIDYMIQSLQLAKDEINYSNNYKNKQEDQGDTFYSYSGYGSAHRSPNGTIIRESLRMVGRMANQVANECTLTPYCGKIFRDN